MELITVNYRIGDDYKSIKCTSIEIYGNSFAFSDIDGELLREDGKIIEAPITGVLLITARQRKK